MGALEFWSSVIRAVAWPIAAFAIVVMLRRPLARLLDRIKHVDLPGGASAEFHETVELAQLLGSIVVTDSKDAAPGALTASAEVGPPPPPPPPRTDSELLPALLGAEQYLQAEVLKALGRLGHPVRSHTPFPRLMTEAFKADLLTQAEMELLSTMRRLRNQAVHESVDALSNASVDVDLLVNSVNQIAINVWSRSMQWYTNVQEP